MNTTTKTITTEFLKNVKYLDLGDEHTAVNGEFYNYLCVEMNDGSVFFVSHSVREKRLVTYKTWDFIEEDFRGTNNFEFVVNNEELQIELLKMAN